MRKTLRNLVQFVVTATIATLLMACANPQLDGSASQESWNEVKNNASVTVHLSAEFGNASALPIASSGWEDGLNVSRNGLNLYATYVPADFLSFVLNGGTPDVLPDYARGPVYDMDFTNPIGDYDWIHSDIIYASRSSTSQDFSAWNTSNMKQGFNSEGALTTVFSDASTIDMAAFTSNAWEDDADYSTNIRILSGTTPNPSGTGSLITAIDKSSTTSINTQYAEDNPHLEYLADNTWVLFFDSEDRPNGQGGLDIWYATSTDGSSWTTPANVTSINAAGTQHQPHLYNDGSNWWLYFAQNDSEGKLAIYRSLQNTTDDWNDWATPELVISAGNTSGIGEPTLTDAGDLYFTVILENPEGTETDTYDADPWFAPAK